VEDRGWCTVVGIVLREGRVLSFMIRGGDAASDGVVVGGVVHREGLCVAIVIVCLLIVSREGPVWEVDGAKWMRNRCLQDGGKCFLA
jgi:hypothetical protein